MISTTKSPQSKSQLVSLIQKLPSSTKFKVVEVLSMKDKPLINKEFDLHKKKGNFSVLFIEGEKQ